MIQGGEGTDNIAYEVDGRLIVRIAKHADTAQVRNEAALLAVVGRHVPFPVPRARAHGTQLIYPKLPGAALIDLPRCHSPQLARQLARMLAAVQAIPPGEVAGLVDSDDYPLPAWLAEAAGNAASVAAEIAEHRAPVQAFLAAPPPAQAASFVFSHNDFGAEHILVDPGTCAVTGVIDWSDAALTDPARDFGLLYRDLGPPALAATPPAWRERAVFYARCSVFEDLVYGLDRGEARYVNKCLAALRWLFPA